MMVPKTAQMTTRETLDQAMIDFYDQAGWPEEERDDEVDDVVEKSPAPISCDQWERIEIE